MRCAASVLVVFVLAGVAVCQVERRAESEYYVRAYALHYGVPLDFVRALIAQESAWKPCALSAKGAAGLMQLMPQTALIFGVRDRCDVRQNVSAGVRYLAHLLSVFHGDLRLVAAAYLAGESRVGARGLDYSNPEVVAYVRKIRGRIDAASNARHYEYQEGRKACR